MKQIFFIICVYKNENKTMDDGPDSFSGISNNICIFDQLYLIGIKSMTKNVMAFKKNHILNSFVAENM